MKKKLCVLWILAAIVLLAAACATPSPSPAPSGVPARPGSSVSGDPSATLPALTEVTGRVKEIKEGLVLITLKDGAGDFMLRFSENSKWAEGVDQEISVGNELKCTVKMEPTFAPPSQGEVFEVLANRVLK